MEDIRRMGESWLKQFSLRSDEDMSQTAEEFADEPSPSSTNEENERNVSDSQHDGESKNVSFYASMSEFVALRSRGEPPEDLDPAFFEEDFDAVRSILEDIPDGANVQYFGIESGKKLLQLDVVTHHFSRQILEHYDDMVEGMRLVKELERDLRIVSIICKNGRRNLTSASQEVSRNLAVTERVRKKQALNDLIQLLLKIREIVHVSQSLQSLLDEEEYAKALRLCSTCLAMIEQSSSLIAVQDMTRSIEVGLTSILQKVDELLLDTCRRFSEESYIKVVDAFGVMEDPTELADKVQRYFTQVILSDSIEILQLFFFQSAQNEDPRTVDQRSRLPYSELCLHIPELYFRPCLRKTLEVLFNLLCSYFKMMTWQYEKAMESLPSTPVGPDSFRLSRKSPVPLSRTLSEVRDPRPDAGQLDRVEDSVQVSPTFSTVQKGANGTGEGVRGGQVEGQGASGFSFSVGSDLQSKTVQEGDWFGPRPPGAEKQDSEEDPEKAALECRVAAARVIQKSLEDGRKSVWEIAARRVSAILSSNVIVAGSAHQFLEVMEWTNQFILIGESFSGSEELGLRAKIAKQSENYFHVYHRQNLEVLRMMQERESWQPLPPSSLDSIDLAGLTGHGAAILQFSTPTRSPQSGPMHLSLGESKSSFADWISSGNPFGEVQQRREEREGSTPPQDPIVHRVSSAKLIEEVGSNSQRSPLSINGGDRSVSSLRPSAWSPHNGIRRIATEHAWRGPAGGGLEEGNEGEEEEEAEEDEEENEELHADFIDEAGQATGGRVYRSNPKPRSNGPMGGQDGKPILTGSSVGLVRFMDRYARLMQALQPIAPLVFKGLSQLFDLYLLTVFRIFGQKEAFTAARIQNETPTTALLTRRLRETLVRISHDLEEYRVKERQPSSRGEQSGQSAGAGEVFGFNSLPTQIVGPGNLYGIRERCVAVESLKFLAGMMGRSRQHFQSLLPQSEIPRVDHFYSRTVEAVPDLREHVFKAQSRLMMNVTGYVDRIAGVRWETKEVGVIEHNLYVGQLVGEYRMFADRLARAGVAKHIQEQLLQFGSEAIAEVLVEGFSKVKRCTNEGRALMSLDLQGIVMGIQAVSGSTPNMQFVENYIKAFYLPETEYLHWARTHSEYTRNQILSIVSLVATMNHWPWKSRQDLLAKIQSGEI